MGRACVGQRFRAAGLWLGLDTVPSKELHNGENDIRALLEMESGARAKVIGLTLSLWA